MNNQSTGLAVSSLILGIAAVVFMNTIVLSVVLGSLAVILAILSRGSDTKFSSKARTGLITGAGSLIISLSIIGYFFIGYATNPSIRSSIDAQYQKQFGITCTEYIDIITDAIVTGDQESIDRLSEVIYK